MNSLAPSATPSWPEGTSRGLATCFQPNPYRSRCDSWATCEEGARHRAGDIFGVEDIESYDLVIAHPPCTHLAVSGARWLTRHWVVKKSHPDGGYWHDPTEKLRQQAEAVEFVKRLNDLPVRRIAIENPISRLSTLFRKPDQIIQPWQFGHGETKATCLWLKNLPLLKPTQVVGGREPRVWMMSGKDRWKNRSRTYIGVAEAMAAQWGAGTLPTPVEQLSLAI